MRSATVLRRVTMAIVLLAVLASPAGAGGMITVENRSAHRVKVAAPGGSAVVDAGADPVPVQFEADHDVGADLRIWWVSKPRELCLLFVPWDRIAIVTGKSVIRCRSQ